jgi:predicted dehydrogenase
MYRKKKSTDEKVREIRVGLIGAGFMGVAHSNAFKSIATWHELPCDVVMQAVCGTDLGKLADFAGKFGWESYDDDWRNLVASEEIDLISVAVPGHLHRDIVVEAARHGKMILCEKPLANNLADAEEMLKAVREARVANCCGFSYRSTPAQALARKLVDQEKIGSIHHVHARYAQDWPSDPAFPMTWRFDRERAGSGSLGDICAHSIDAARFITGLEFVEVVGNLATVIKERPADESGGSKMTVTVDDVAQFLCTFDNGATGCFEATRMATGRKNHNCIEVNGEKGSLYWNFEEQNYLYFYDKTRPVAEQGFTKINVTHDTHPYGGGPWPQGHGIGYADTFVIEIAGFLKSILNDEEYHPDFEDGVKCQRVLEAVARSAIERKWVPVGSKK